MKKLLAFAALFAVVALTSCKYDDDDLWNSVHGLENRVAKLEELCKQMNTNISSLQTIVTALQNNVYVTGTTPLMKDGKEIGYTITFSKGNPITIYHGKDGQDGEDGITPTISVKKDTDGVYYWTLNGEFIVVDGGKIQAEGKDGTNGTTPQFKIENDYWFVSYNNGANWTQLGKATGEDGIGGDSMFSGVDYETSTDYVIFTLSNGTQIKLPTWSAFEALQRLCNETNTNLSALQTIVTALQNNDYITSVDPLTENGKVVGYTIKFAKSNPIVIYNGKDGADGNTPIIGVKQDEDGIYYWTLDDKFIVVDGQKIKAQGTDGVSPKLEIREGYWWISYDNGANWTQLGQATGEDGKDGDSIKITQDEDNVYFELADGTIITLPKNCSNESIIQFKDENFFNALLAERVDTDGDGQISTREAASCITLDISENNITSIDEIHYFTTLVELDCSDNQLTSLDISKNTALTRLNCGGNQLTSLDVSKNTALIRLSCSNNQLVSLDIDTNIELKLLNCGLNQLTALDISKNTALTTLNLSGNRLTLLNVNLNAALVKLTCGDNQLISLNVSKNTALTELSCYGNRLIDLDVSKNTALTWLDIDNNQLTSLDVSKNRELKSLLCNNNPLHSLIIYKYHKINAAHTDEIMKEYSDIITYIE